MSDTPREPERDDGATGGFGAERSAYDPADEPVTGPPAGAVPSASGSFGSGGMPGATGGGFGSGGMSGATLGGFGSGGMSGATGGGFGSADDPAAEPSGGGSVAWPVGGSPSGSVGGPAPGPSDIPTSGSTGGISGGATPRRAARATPGRAGGPASQATGGTPSGGTPQATAGTGPQTAGAAPQAGAGTGRAGRRPRRGMWGFGPAANGPLPERERRRRRLFVAGIAVAAALVVIAVCAGALSVVSAIDHARDRAADARQSRRLRDDDCLELEARLNRLVPPGAATAPAARATAIRNENAAVRIYLGRLHDERDTDAWRQLIDARTVYADALDRQAQSRTPAFFVVPKTDSGVAVSDELVQWSPASCAGPIRRLAVPEL